MQEAPLRPPQAATPPATPVPATAAAPQLAGVPTARYLSRQEISALRARRTEISNQLQSAEGRRNELSQSLRRPDVAGRTGIEERIALLDKRLISLETDLAETGKLLAMAAPVDQTAGTTQPPRGAGPLSSDQITGISIVFTIVVMAPLAIAFARVLWKRAIRPAAPPAPSDFADRFERLEQAVDAIAIEVERVSEGQRFVTRVLTEGQAVPVLGAGAAEPIPLREREALGLSRERS